MLTYARSGSWWIALAKHLLKLPDMEDLKTYRMRVFNALRILKDRDPDWWSVIQSVLSEPDVRNFLTRNSDQPHLRVVWDINWLNKQ